MKQLPQLRLYIMFISNDISFISFYTHIYNLYIYIHLYLLVGPFACNHVRKVDASLWTSSQSLCLEQRLEPLSSVTPVLRLRIAEGHTQWPWFNGNIIYIYIQR